MITAAQASDVFTKIIARAPFKVPVMAKARHLNQKERTALIREFIRGFGKTGISVTAAKSSMCFWTRVALPNTTCRYSHESYEAVRECPACVARRAAVEHLKTLINAAFPDLDDRSDSMTDYFDPMVIVD